MFLVENAKKECFFCSNDYATKNDILSYEFSYVFVKQLLPTVIATSVLQVLCKRYCEWTHYPDFMQSYTLRLSCYAEAPCFLCESVRMLCFVLNQDVRHNQEEKRNIILACMGIFFTLLQSKKATLIPMSYTAKLMLTSCVHLVFSTFADREICAYAVRSIHICSNRENNVLGDFLQQNETLRKSLRKLCQCKRTKCSIPMSIVRGVSIIQRIDMHIFTDTLAQLCEYLVLMLLRSEPRRGVIRYLVQIILQAKHRFALETLEILCAYFASAPLRKKEYIFNQMVISSLVVSHPDEMYTLFAKRPVYLLELCISPGLQHYLAFQHYQCIAPPPSLKNDIVNDVQIRLVTPFRTIQFYGYRNLLQKRTNFFANRECSCFTLQGFDPAATYLVLQWIYRPFPLEISQTKHMQELSTSVQFLSVSFMSNERVFVSVADLFSILRVAQQFYLDDLSEYIGIIAAKCCLVHFYDEKFPILAKLLENDNILAKWCYDMSFCSGTFHSFQYDEFGEE